MTLDEYYRAFTHNLLRVSSSKNIRQVFADYCRLEALEIQALIGVLTDYDASEHASIVSRYSPKQQGELKAMSELLMSAAAEHPYSDLLGWVFMNNAADKKHPDQYFSHPNIGTFISAALVLEYEIKKQGFLRIAETSCGSGTMFLTQAAVVKRVLHMEPSSVLLLDATDIDRICADMCYIQLSLNKLTGIVRCDNALYHKNNAVMITPAFQGHLQRAKKSSPELLQFLMGLLTLQT